MNVTCKLLSEITTTNKFTWLTKVPLHVMAPTAKWRRLDPVVLFSNDPGQNTNVVWNGLKRCYNTIIIFNQRPWPLKQKNRRRIPRLYFKKRGSEVVLYITKQKYSFLYDWYRKTIDIKYECDYIKSVTTRKICDL